MGNLSPSKKHALYIVICNEECTKAVEKSGVNCSECVWFLAYCGSTSLIIQRAKNYIKDIPQEVLFEVLL